MKRGEPFARVHPANSKWGESEKGEPTSRHQTSMTGTRKSPACACKGIRTCALCEDSKRVRNLQLVDVRTRYADYCVYVYDPAGRESHPAKLSAESTLEQIRDEAEAIAGAGGGMGSNILDGIRIVENFVTEKEEASLVDSIDRCVWVASQSGRRKQDYGPRVNFKERKVKMDTFEGLPTYADLIVERMGELGMVDFRPVELCNLEYDEARASSIEPHKDDCWIWGERLVSVSLLNDCVMSFVDEQQHALVYALLPRRSLLVMSSDARHRALHGIFSHHVRDRRVVVTMRELAPQFPPGGDAHNVYGEELMRRSSLRIPQ